MTPMARGPAMIGIEGLELSAADRERLLHPLVGGAILFTRNYADHAQLAALVGSIRALRDPPLVVAVDHEGGHVQRFRDGFAEIAPMRTLGELWDRDIAAATRAATRVGWTIGHELRAHGIDLSFTPVLDLDYGASAVIGNRAFHRNPNAVAHLAAALRRGLAAAGMAACGKHYPGHGHVAADSHTDVPVDPRPFAAIAGEDLVPFAALAREGLESVMVAHVRLPGDRRRAGRVLVAVVHRGAARAARLRRARVLRRPRHGRRGDGGRPRGPRRCRRSRRMRRDSRLQRHGGGRRSAGALATAAGRGSRAALVPGRGPRRRRLPGLNRVRSRRGLGGARVSPGWRRCPGADAASGRRPCA